MITLLMYFPFQILNEIAQHKIRIYEFPECDDEEESKIQKKLRVGISVVCLKCVLYGPT